MKLTGSKTERIVAGVFGALLLLGAFNMSPPFPSGAEGVGFYLVWLAMTGAGIWLVLYASGLVHKKKTSA
jgi:hypothetical protein